MSMTDPIADLLTRIRNAHLAKHKSLDVPASRVKLEIVRIMKDEGYVEDYQSVEDSRHGLIRIGLKYLPSGAPAIRGIERVSRPGLRIYRGKDEIPKVLNGLGVVIVSTPRGILTGNACHRNGVGGEVLCNIW
jgi:small subunit ribosomal protein S8